MTANRPPAPPEPVTETPPVAVPPEPSVSSADMGSLDDINKKGILAPVFFEFDSAEMSSEGQATLAKNAETMKQFQTWVVSIEGHCDERGTAEYNLALGERRAAVGEELPGLARHRRRTAPHRQLRQGVPLRSRPRRVGVVAQPPRQLRRHRQVSAARFDEVRHAVISSPATA